MAHKWRMSGWMSTLLGLLVLGISAGALWYWQPWRSLGLGEVTDLVTPVLDGGHARQAIITAKYGGTISVIDGRRVRTTLTIPPGALTQDTTVQLVPLFESDTPDYPTSGVMVVPGDLAFTRPASLTFDIEGSGHKSDAPASVNLTDITLTRSSQVLLLDATANTLTPMLVTRPAEINTVIPARIVSGGVFVWSLSSAKSIDYARSALLAKRVHPVVALEAGSRLYGSHRSVSKREKAAVERAVKGVLAAQSPAGPELFAALALQKQYGVGQARGLITPAYAADLDRKYFERRCDDRSMAFAEYVTVAQAAQLLGYEELGETCLKVVKTIVEQESEVLLATPNAPIVQLAIQLQRVQVLGLDDNFNLDERLLTQTQDQIGADGQAVLNRATSTSLDVARAIQQFHTVGGNPQNDLILNALSAKLVTLSKLGVQPSTYDGTYPELLPGFETAVIALPLARILGLEAFDESGLREFTANWRSAGTEFGTLAGMLCALPAALDEVAPSECATVHRALASTYRKLGEAGYRAAAELEQIANQEFEEPAYGDAPVTIACADDLTADERTMLGCPEPEVVDAPPDNLLRSR